MSGYEEDPFRAVEALELQLAAGPDDPELAHRLALALEASTTAARSLTRDQRLVLTSRLQLDVCERAARRILELRVDDQRLTFGAQALLAEVAAARRWVWHKQGEAMAYTVAGAVTGLAGSVAGGLAGSIPIVVCSALVSSLVAAAVVLRHRREHWTVQAEQARPVIWRPGI
jgi:hypothetical protein